MAEKIRPTTSVRAFDHVGDTRANIPLRLDGEFEPGARLRGIE